jgi:hypothetical protein
MKYINIFSIIIISLIISSCQSNNLEQESDAIYKSIKKIYTLNADGSANYQYQHQLKYITHFSFNRLYGESFIVYNPDQQELKINKAETKMVDGKIVPSPENAFNEILPRFAAGAPPFNHLREMVVTHAGLELGCVVDFDYELSSKAGYLPFFNENIILQENVPVENLEIIVNIPDETELNHNLINIETKAKVSKKDGYTQYTWKFKNLNGLVREANQAHDKSFLPRLTFSNINMQNALNKLYNNLDLTLTDNIKETITKRVSDKKKEIHIIRELQKIVDKEMNTLRIPLEYTAYSARPLSEVWESNAGTELEKTFLFNELLKFLDVDSKVILAVSPEIYNKEVGNLKDAGHYYIQTKIDGEDIIISTNLNQANNLALNLKGIGIIDEEANSINIPDSISDLESSFKAEGSFQMNDSGGISGEVKIIVKGMKNPYLNYLDQTKNAKEVVTSLYAANAIEDYDVINFDNKQSEINATIKDKEIWKNQGNYYFMETPTSSYGIKGEHLSTLLNERKTPLQLSNFINESYDFNISLPEGFSLVSPNIKKELSNGIGSVIIEISSSDRDVHVIKSLKINKLVINPIEYNDFKNLINL